MAPHGPNTRRRLPRPHRHQQVRHAEPGLRLDETTLLRDYPVAGILRTSCNDDHRSRQSIEALKAAIAGTIAQDHRLKHVRDPIPGAWLRVKDAVTERARRERLLELRQFESLCTADPDPGQSITDPNEQRALLGLLHDLGVVVAHGLDRNAPAARREITLLDPNWLTGAIYALITSPTVLRQNGELPRAQIGELLDPTLYPPERHEFILDMMKTPELGLCFDLPSKDAPRYLIPEALSPNEPDYDDWPADSLRFRYQYKHLPQGLIPRFIVQTHRNLTDKPTRWRTGVVLAAEGCRILVRGDRDNQRIDIQVAGPAARQRSALGVVLNDFDPVHAAYEHIDAEAMVPLPDQHSEAVPYDHLLRLEELEGPDHEFLPVRAQRKYTVKELLDGVRREGARLPAKHPPPSAAAQPAPEQDWRKLSLICGGAAGVFVLILMLLPDTQWRLWVGAPILIGAAVALFVLSRNPRYYYRRMINYVMGGGLLAQALGFAVEAGAQTNPQQWGWIKWDGSIHPAFYAAWTAIIVALIKADRDQQRN